MRIADAHGWGEDPVIVTGLATGAITLLWLGRLDEVEQWLERAERTLHPDGEPGTELIVRHTRGLMRLVQGRLEEALTAFREAQRMQALLADRHPFTLRTQARLLQTVVSLAIQQQGCLGIFLLGRLGGPVEAGQVETGGNLGTPALSLAPLGAEGSYVLELSSYQLELIRSLRFDIAVLLNITPDHLDRHGGMEGYIAAKRRIFARLEQLMRPDALITSNTSSLPAAVFSS